MYTQLKRIGALALTIAVLVSMMVLPSANAVLLDETITLGFGEVKDTSTSVGGQATDVVQVPITATSTKETFAVRAMELYVTFNKDVLKLVKVTKGKILDTEIPNPDDPEEEPTKNALNLSNSAAALATANEKGCYKAVFSDLTENQLNHVATSGEPVMTMYFTRTTNDSSVISFVPPTSDPDYASKKQIIATATTDEYKVTSDATFTVPSLGPGTVKVTYKANGGTGDDIVDDVTPGTSITLKPADTFGVPDGKEFDAWEVNGAKKNPSETITVNANTEIKALWKDVMVKVTYKANGGTGDDIVETVNKGDSVTLKPANTFTAPDGKEFDAWEVNGAKKNPGESIAVNANTEIKALWKAVNVTVTYKANGGTGNDITETVNKGATVTLKPANTFGAPDGQEFDAWQVDGAKKNPGESIAVNANTEIKALWKDVMVTVTYKANSGTGDDIVETVNKGATVTLKPANTFTAPDGKQFDAWEVSGAKKNPGEQVSITADTTVKALWKDIVMCKVTFDANGAEGSMDDMTIQQGQKLKLPACGFSPLSGKAFKAWDVNGTEYASGKEVEITADTTIKAVWGDLPVGGCYVATAVYGSYDCPQVWTLRRFRDNVLAETWYGRLFIKAYYAVSPTCVKLFGNSEIFQNFFRGILDPWVADLQAEGFESTPYNDVDW